MVLSNTRIQGHLRLELVSPSTCRRLSFTKHSLLPFNNELHTTLALSFVFAAFYFTTLFCLFLVFTRLSLPHPLSLTNRHEKTKPPLIPLLQVLVYQLSLFYVSIPEHFLSWG